LLRFDSARLPHETEKLSGSPGGRIFAFFDLEKKKRKIPPPFVQTVQSGFSLTPA
jgi:hypothetical protein